jgi:catechol 2,3-dioxygenase-like lactoylglutathione lyase family enzyme
MSMLGSKDAIATIAVTNMARAALFYEGILGFERSQSMGESAAAYKCGRTSLFVYESQFAGTNKATAATWIVGGDLDAIVDDLRRKGVTFEHYRLPNTTLEGDIHITEEGRVAWFKDPDGNILSIASD